MNKQKTIIIILSVALFVLAQYVIYEKIIESRQQEVMMSYQNGYNKGLSDAVTTIYKQTENCQTTTITIGNFSKTVFDITCLKIQQKNMTH